MTHAGLRAFEAEYEALAKLPEHGHGAPFVTYVIAGDYIERAGRQERLCARGAVIFHEHESHSNEVGRVGAGSLNVELDPDLWKALTGSCRVVAALSGRVLGGDIEWPALRVWREFHRPDSVSVLGMEEALVLLLSTARDAHRRGVFEPHSRLDRCLDYLRAHRLAAHRLADIARIADVHPMHLARLFRRRMGCSMGEFLRRRRVAWACEQLGRSDETIAAIALRAGFADHAHFTRTFVRLVGSTPRWYRTQARHSYRRSRAVESPL